MTVVFALTTVIVLSALLTGLALAYMTGRQHRAQRHATRPQPPVTTSRAQRRLTAHRRAEAGDPDTTLVLPIILETHPR